MAEKTYTIRFREKGADNVKREVRGIDRAAEKLTAALKNVALGFAGMFGASGVFNLAKDIIKTTVLFEDLRVRLTALYGSVERGTVGGSMIFAA